MNIQTLLASATILLLCQPAHAQQCERDTSMVSLTSTGALATFRSNFPVVSSDGAVVAFESSANNLVPGDTNGRRDIFVRDLIAGTTTRVSVSSSGQQGNNHSYNPFISSNGRYVSFHSKASNFVSGDLVGGTLDAFLHDRVSGTTTHLSTGPLGALGNANSMDVVVTPDGTLVAFDSAANNLVPNDLNNRVDIFIRDVASGATTLVSVSSAGVQGDNSSRHAALSADGQIVVFTSAASNLVAGDSNNSDDVFVRDIPAGTTTRISTSTAGTQSNSYSWFPSISSNGRYVAFESRGSTLVPNDTNNVTDIFLHDRVTGVTSIVSVTSNGTRASAASNRPSISADGTRIAFQSWANLDGGASGVDTYVHETLGASTRLVSVDSNGNIGNGHSIDVGISPDGRYVVFQSGSSDLVAGDANGFEDIFMNDSLGRAMVATRNAGANPASYTASTPVLGGIFSASVDLSTTGHSFAAVYGFLAATNVTLMRGQVLLVSGPRVVQLPMMPGPLASWAVPLPNDPSLAGLQIFSQALHIQGVTPFALSNAQDLCLGY